MEEFVEQLNNIGYKNVLPMKVNGYRKERLYFSAESPSGDKVFVKWLIKGDSTEKREISYEKLIGKTLGRQEYPLPPKYGETCVISKFIDSVGDIKSVIKRETNQVALDYIRKSIENYIRLLEQLNGQRVECFNYGYLELIDIYSKRWAYYSKKPKCRKEIAYYSFVLYARMLKVKYRRKIIPQEYVILGDLNSGNCLCLADKTVKCIDYEKVCCSDPNIDMANYIVKIRHHAKNNVQLLQGIDEALEIFMKCKYYREDNYKFAYLVFDFIDRNWS